MALVTLQLIEGLERGRVYLDLPTPVTLGREDENTIRLNDERVSRFHAKIQEDGGKVILTDLDSTNGTRVNGHPVQMRVLQLGDQLSIGRCLLIYGSRDEITRRARELLNRPRPPRDPHPDHTVRAPRDSSSDFDSLDEPFADSDSDSSSSFARPLAPPASAEPVDELLFPHGPPPPPSGLRPHQRAEIADMMAYIHEQIRTVLLTGHEEDADRRTTDEGTSAIRVPWAIWQRLLHLEMDMAVYLRKIADPDSL